MFGVETVELLNICKIDLTSLCSKNVVYSTMNIPNYNFSHLGVTIFRDNF